MRRRTPSEIKAYGDGYAEAYKEFCHLLEKNDKDKAIRKMKILADAVALTVETATDKPQTAECPFDDPIPCEWVNCPNSTDCPYKQKTEQTELVNDSQVLAKDLVDDEFNPYDEECMRCKHLKLKCEFIPTYCKFESRDEPQTCSVNGRPYSDCSSCEHFRCTADEPQTDWKDEMWTETVQTDCTTCEQVGRCERGRAVDCPLTERSE